MQIDGQTVLIPIIGSPIKPVKSPAVLNEIFAGVGRNAKVIPLEIAPDNFQIGFRGILAAANVAGIIVTMPFKILALKFADEVLPTGTRIGAVNALRRSEKGEWQADMFDGKGLINAMHMANMTAGGAKVTIVGVGGAGLAIADALAENGVESINLVEINQYRADVVAQKLVQNFPKLKVSTDSKLVSQADILINATPIGMQGGEEAPVDLNDLRAPQIVIDIIPTPEVTPLLARARDLGCRTLNGRKMTEGQAEALCEFFFR